MKPGAQRREDADVDTASESYATRFSGPVGSWFLRKQAETTLHLLNDLPVRATILDVGGGHGQIAPVLSRAGYRVTVVGSDPSCGVRLASQLGEGSYRFQVADLQNLPYEPRTFDAVVCFRLLPHSINWTGLLSELCRVARLCVVLDYPSTRSINLFAERLFSVKQRIEGNTRRFALFHPRLVNQAFQQQGFSVTAATPQFFLPMVLYRVLGSPRLGSALEAPAKLLGLTRWLGSPIITRADRTSL